jgi:hypothetical protein
MQFSMPGMNVSGIAVFQRCYALRVFSASANQTVSVDISPLRSGGCSLGSFISGSSIQLNADCAAGYVFSSWQSIVGGGTNSAIVSSVSSFTTLTGNNDQLFIAQCSAVNTQQPQADSPGGYFNTSTRNKGGISARTLFEACGVAVAANGDVWIADTFNNRVLQYFPRNTTATRVYGQGGHFDSALSNFPSGIVSGTSLNTPFGVALDASNILYIGDTYNHRVLAFLSGSTAPFRSYGQGGSFTTVTLNYPSGVPTDPVCTSLFQLH